MSFTDLSAHDCIERVSLLLSRSLLLPRFKANEPLPCLSAFLSALINGDIAAATRCYHEFAASLLDNDVRRVSGELFQDYLLHLVLVSDDFYHLCLGKKQPGRQDSLARAMRHELCILSELRGISSPLLYRLIRERARDVQLSGGKDDIAVMTSAVWAGENIARTAQPKPGKKLTSTYSGKLAPEVDFLSFRYGEVALRDSYAADEALEEMYFRLMESSDWSNLFQSICDMRLAYGSDDFLRYRRFFFCGDTLMPMDKLDADGLPVTVPEPIPFYDSAREAIMDNVIAFMRGDEYDNLILLGPPATGKTSLVMTVPDELSELRFVFVSGDGYLNIRSLEYMLARQPYRFLVVLDRLFFAEINEKVEVALLLDRINRGAEPKNIIFIATARILPDCPCSFEPVRLPALTQAEFMQVVAELRDNFAAKAGEDAIPEFSREDIINACLDLRIDLSADSLNLILANRVLKKCRANSAIKR